MSHTQRAFTRCAQTACTVLLFMATGVSHAQQDYPNRPIRWIIPYAPGGATTVLGRLFGDKLTAAWGQQVIVDNRPGGNTILGSEAMVRAAPDGHTLLLPTTTHVINAVLIPKLPYDSHKDFAPVATLVAYEPVLFLHPSIPANTLKEFIAFAKARPGQLNYGTAGTGGATHLGCEYFNMLAGVKSQLVPYKGTAPSVVALLSGEVHWLISAPSTLIAHVKARKLKAIAVGGATRLASLPQAPTFSEGGLPAYELKGWYSVMAPAATPRAIIDKLSAEIGRIAQSPEIRERLTAQEMEPFFNSAGQFAALLKSETVKYASIVKAAKIRYED